MSFGFGVGDFITVGKLVWDVYSAYADAPEQFRNFSQEIMSLHVVFQQLEDQLHKTTTFSAKDTQNLKTLHDGLKGIMEELDALLKKYQSLSDNHSVSFDRLKWGQEDLVGLRDRLRSNITLLTTFNASLANCQLIRIQQQLGQLLVARGLRRRGSVASLHSIASFALSIGQSKAWKELSRELHCNISGITAEMIKAKKEEIFKLFRTASRLSFSGNPDGGALPEPETNSTAGKQGKGVDWRTFGAMMEVLSLPATQARYFVARLVGSKSARALHIAAANGETSLVKVLLDKGANINATSDNRPRWTALHHAASNGHIKVVKVLLDRGADMELISDNGSALHRAAREGHIAVVKELLDRGAAIDAMDDTKSTALHPAATGGHIKVVKELLDRGATVDAMNDHKWTCTALYRAASFGHIEVVKMLLDRGATIDATNDHKSTALHWAAIGGHIEVVKILLDRGTTIDAMDDTKSTALHWAARHGCIEVVKVLLDRGATIDATADYTGTALHGAATWGHIEVVKELLDRGAAIDAMDDTKSTALHWAATGGHTEVVKILLGRGATVDAAADSKWTALHQAAHHGYIEVVKVLLDRGANIDATNVKGRTTLHEACNREISEWLLWDPRRIDVVKALLERRTSTSIDITDKSGDTALHCAARRTRPSAEIIQLLLDNGANTDRKNDNGETALDIARRRGWGRGVTLLTSTPHIDKVAGIDSVL